MTNLHHHASDAALLSYAAGALAAPHNYILEKHLAQCPECEGKVGLGERIGAVMVTYASTLPEVPNAPDDLERFAQNAFSARMLNIPDFDLRPVGLKRGTLAPGVDFRILQKEGSAILVLAQIQAKRFVPMHDHQGFELMLPLQGRFQADGLCYGPGDLLEIEEGGVHKIENPFDTPCLCLAALDGVPVWTSPWEKIRQRIFGL